MDVRERFCDILAGNDKYSHCAITDSIEVKVFFRLFYIRAALNMLSTKKIWYHESSNNLFVVTMSMNRSIFLSTFLIFDGKISRDERWKCDKFACIREFFEKVNKSHASMRYPSSYLAIDEALYPYRRRIGIKQCNPGKPVKYGVS